MGNIFGKTKKDTSRITEQDKAVLVKYSDFQMLLITQILYYRPL